ncbi:[LysW]-aminoadipate kinase [Plantactinospora mayteni]|uniref:Acetylglutamate kinase n=1 Tax=Plantactinospora mayteni TaxID=566021 RepID=A0ABQ4EIH0_9ACTN|nr:[LysW]-aminoadipate kinase [Plantactinospora mayteni]GIG94007.1 acetylglutamate kinase [Plantactinospora mayteni]
MDVVVVKCGGNAAVDAAAVCADVAALHLAGTPVVLVHGGSAEIDRLAGRLGVPRRELVSPDGVTTRYTDAATLEVVQLALAGIVKPRLVAGLARHGVPAAGLTGLDAGLLRARRKRAVRAVSGGRRVVVHDQHAGRLDRADPAVLLAMLGAGVVPVVSPPAADEDGAPVNVDADRAAAAIAATLRACALVLLTGAPGVQTDPDDPGSVLPAVTVGDTLPAYAAGGMALKLVAAREALAGGVPRVVVAAGSGPEPVRAALAGGGTLVGAR